MFTLIEIPSDRDIIHHEGIIPKGAERKRLDLEFLFIYLFFCLYVLVIKEWLHVHIPSVAFQPLGF